MTLNKLVSGKGRYSSDGWNVYQGEKLIATCHTGDQGQLASSIAARIAALLNADFVEFCEKVANQ